jgi:hypothetical protein
MSFIPKFTSRLRAGSVSATNKPSPGSADSSDRPRIVLGLPGPPTVDKDLPKLELSGPVSGARLNRLLHECFDRLREEEVVSQDRAALGEIKKALDIVFSKMKSATVTLDDRRILFEEAIDELGEAFKKNSFSVPFVAMARDILVKQLLPRLRADKEISNQPTQVQLATSLLQEVVAVQLETVIGKFVDDCLSGKHSTKSLIARATKIGQEIDGETCAASSRENLERLLWDSIWEAREEVQARAFASQLERSWRPARNAKRDEVKVERGNTAYLAGRVRNQRFTFGQLQASQSRGATTEYLDVLHAAKTEPTPGNYLAWIAALPLCTLGRSTPHDVTVARMEVVLTMWQDIHGTSPADLHWPPGDQARAREQLMQTVCNFISQIDLQVQPAADTGKLEPLRKEQLRQYEIIFLKLMVSEKQGGVSRAFAKEVLSCGLSPALDKLEGPNAVVTDWPELEALKARIHPYITQAPMLESPAD